MSATPVDDLHLTISAGRGMLGVVVGKSFMFYAECLPPRLLSVIKVNFPGVRI
jgi:hypothetical protein